ncbi:DUF3016 domain-containing protein [Colwellia sp. D2M02]|uniref:DUF3016 domain-containing protein n=1 Tax=Colwellia sp. D2M02 TaxID=2841562 RepID=UPI001C099559|nr:DUF3016 domain-containing protein [Colwellia sp. D2M02]MBU2893680.1 DUF3016 domain-containing protein [Colwellia sp. D2M02]
MKKLVLLSALMMSILIAPNTFAATSEVTWGDYKKFRDIDEGNENRKSFRERTFKEFEKHFAKLAETLPEDQVLKIAVTDVDLAGDTRFSGVNQMRIIKDNYFPRINLSYDLVDQDGKSIKAETVVIKDMNFMMGSHLKYRNESLTYEKQMLDDWFKETFKALIVE